MLTEEEEFLGIIRTRLPKDAVVIDSYWLWEPYARAVIAVNPVDRRLTYFVLEPSISKKGVGALMEISNIIETELDPRELTELRVDSATLISKFLDKTLSKYRGLVRDLPKEEVEAIRYYVLRNFVGLGHLEPLFRDGMIEDISCNGVDVPIYVFHRRYESLPTNLRFASKESLNNYIVMLAHRSGKHISSAFPILDAMLPGQYRVAATYGDEVTMRGGSFTIRKFREEPFSIVDLVRMNVLPAELAAYSWVLMENKYNLMVIGATGAGKTTLLTAICSMIPPNFKIVTVEETPEIQLSHTNWTRLVTREAYGYTGTVITAITLFDLVKTSLRYRPDYLIVGEVRGEEAYVLFQAMATGHGGVTTMHAESVRAVISRLTSPPMNIAPTYIPILNLVMKIDRVMTYVSEGVRAPMRKVTAAWEIISHEEFNEIMRWDESTNVFELDLRRSNNLRMISERRGIDIGEVIEEVNRRALYLEWLVSKGVSKAKEVTELIGKYYLDPKKAFMEASHGLQQLKQEQLKAIGRAVDGTSMIISLLSRMGGVALLPELYKSSGLQERAFWAALNSLLSERKIEIKDDMRVILK